MKRSNLRTAIFFLLFAVVFAGIGAGTALAVQTHMINARGNLQNALVQLKAATPDKGGHRVNAINDVNAAINQVNLGIAAGAQ
jgi:hypothetical protein